MNEESSEMRVVWKSKKSIFKKYQMPLKMKRRKSIQLGYLEFIVNLTESNPSIIIRTTPDNNNKSIALTIDRQSLM